jgi:hypothetical protein
MKDRLQVRRDSSVRKVNRVAGTLIDCDAIIVSGFTMKTALDIDDTLLAGPGLAAREHVSLSRVIEEAIALRLRRRPTRSRVSAPPLPVNASGGGLARGVKDSVSNRALLDSADDADGA